MNMTTADMLAIANKLPAGSVRSSLLAQLRTRYDLPDQAAVAPSRAAVGTPEVLALTIVLPIRTVSEANTRNGAAAYMGRKKAQRSAVRDRLRSMAAGLPALPAVVTLTRVGRRPLDDDNLAGALKHVRDGVADAYGVDDGSALYQWVPAQRTCRAGYAVEIRIETEGQDAARVAAATERTVGR